MFISSNCNSTVYSVLACTYIVQKQEVKGTLCTTFCNYAYHCNCNSTVYNVHSIHTYLAIHRTKCSPPARELLVQR